MAENAATGAVPPAKPEKPGGHLRWLWEPPLRWWMPPEVLIAAVTSALLIAWTEIGHLDRLLTVGDVDYTGLLVWGIATLLICLIISKHLATGRTPLTAARAVVALLLILTVAAYSLRTAKYPGTKTWTDVLAACVWIAFALFVGTVFAGGSGILLGKAIDRASQAHKAANRPPTPPGELAYSVKVTHEVFEISSFIFIILGVVIALVELRLHLGELRRSQLRERQIVAEQAYKEVDDRFAEYLKMCSAYENIDCYSKPLPTIDIGVTPESQRRQDLVDTVLIDVFEFAFIRYHDENYSSVSAKYVEDQWPGWVFYMRKFAIRGHVKAVWTDIGKEYDAQFQACFESILARPVDLGIPYYMPRSCAVEAR
jgi:hypothetical protein